ncbi:S24 family peptidase, partial [Streptococcus sp. A18]|uniref:S24 family peptidase n=1 Tax=Streptococcus sp. A18 TaxID=3373125 RepID=UPI00374DD11A
IINFTHSYPPMPLTSFSVATSPLGISEKATLLCTKFIKCCLFTAGHGSSFYDEYETREVFTDKDYLYDVATWITGQSMEPVYLDGEVALIREGGFDNDGAVYAVAWNKQLYIKKVYLENNGFRLVSINKDYPDKFAPTEDEPRIVGKIVGNFMPIEQ